LLQGKRRGVRVPIDHAVIPIRDLRRERGARQKKSKKSDRERESTKQKNNKMHERVIRSTMLEVDEG
jgi:hypothetical protein